MKKFLLFAVLSGLLFGWTVQKTYAQAVTGVTLNKHTLSLDRWASEKLTATVSPDDAANKNVNWQSSNSAIISVDADGNVSANHDGEATVFVKTEEGGFADSCVVTCRVDDAANIVEFSFAGEGHATSISDNQAVINGYMPHGTDVSNLTVASYQISPGGSISPLPETVHDFSDTVSFVVTAPDGTTQKTWKVFPQIMPDLSGTQKIKITFKTAPQEWIGDTVSWEESNIHFHIAAPGDGDPPSAQVMEDQDYSGKMGIGLFPAELQFYLKDTNKVIVAASLYIMENCGSGCTYIRFNGLNGDMTDTISPATKKYYVYNLSGVKAVAGIFRSFESIFSGITFWVANKNGSVNQPPVANAGPDQTVTQGDSVYLDGTGSFDPDGDSLRYQWLAPGGITLTNPASATLSFKAPETGNQAPFTLSIALIVNDGKTNSEHDTVFVRVNPKNRRPVAFFDIDSATVNEGDTAHIDGHYSYDPDGDSLSFHWSTDAGSGIVFFDSTAMDVRCGTPKVNRDTIFNIYLSVDDGSLYSKPDTFYLTVKTANRAPVAKIVSTAQIFYGVSMNEGDTLWIDGSPSYDPDGDSITYDWAIAKAFDSYHYDSVKVMVVAPMVTKTTSFNATLFVKDYPGQLQAKDDFIIQVRNVNHVPIADAGKPFNVLSGKTGELNGSGSGDPDGDSLRFTWIAPSGITLSDVHAERPSFTAPEVTSDQSYTFGLVVSDGHLLSDTAQVEVIVEPIAATMSVTATLSGDTIAYRNRHITLYWKNDDGQWVMENILSYNDNGETYYAVWQGYWMITVDPVGDSAGFVSTFSGDVAWWAESNDIFITGGTETHVNIHCIAAGGNLTGDGVIDGYIQRDTTTAGITRNSITHVDNGTSGDVPAAGVTVYLYRSSDDLLLASTLTDNDGLYVFNNLPVDAYYLLVQLPGYAANTPWPVEVSASNTTVDDVNFLVSEGNQEITDVKGTEEMSMKLYPNPVKDMLYIQSNNHEKDAVVQVYDLTGHLVITENMENHTTRIDVSGLRKGIYLLRMENNGEMVTRKFIRQ